MEGEDYIPFDISDQDFQVDFDLIQSIQILNERSNYLSEAIQQWIIEIENIPKQDFLHLNVDPTLELIEGLIRLKLSVDKESKHLNLLLKNENEIQFHHIHCSNLPYLEAVYLSAKQQKGLVTLFKTFPIIENDIIDKVRIDIVGDHGLSWIKVSARNSKFLNLKIFNHMEIKSEEQLLFESKINLLKKASEVNKFHFKIPKIQFLFTNLNNLLNFNQPNLINYLNSIGIECNRCPLELNSIHPFNNVGDITKLPLNSLHLDITTLIALASELTNTFEIGKQRDINVNQYKHTHPLYLQVQQESIKPLLPILSNLFQNKTLYCSKSSYDKIISITSTIAGNNERLRVKCMFRYHHNDLEMIQCDHQPTNLNHPFFNWRIYNQTNQSPIINVINDIHSNSFQSLLDLKCHKLLSSFHIKVFGTAYECNQSCVTANTWLTRCLINAPPSILPNRDFILFHEPRSFVENKLF